MRKFAVLFVCIAAGLSLTAQKKSVNLEQVFKNAAFDIIKQLPVSDKWVDDEHYTEHRQDENGHWNWWLVEAKTGKAVIDPHPPQEETMITPRAEPLAAGDKRNGTTSPDGKWLAYTKKDNNLYVEELATREERQVTADGSETILNGYASWVYYEEILGRQSRYRAFWWSPDSKRVAFMRFDESNTPVFPIYWADGQHGRLENQRYPKVG